MIYTALLVYIPSFLLTPIISTAKLKVLEKEKQRESHMDRQNGQIFDNDSIVSSKKARREHVVNHLSAIGYILVEGSQESATQPDGEMDPLELESKPSSSADTIRTLLLGCPSWTSQIWSLATLAINVVLVLGVVDAIYRGPMLHPSKDLSFTRVGFVSENSAKILVREPNASRVPLYVSYREISRSISEPRWHSAESLSLLSGDTDYTSTTTLLRLRPSTEYEYAVSNNLSGFFTTAPPVGQMARETSKFNFLTSSCIKPRFPYNPLAHPLSIPGLRYVSKWLPNLKASFMLFLGDFIYIDVPNRFGSDVETYRREYRQVYASPDWPAVSSIPWLHVIDDHEIANDWDKRTADPYSAAIDPWNIYHASVNPPAAASNASYYIFRQGPASFFMMDTRRYRSLETVAAPHSATKTMLGSDQLSSLLAFLKRDEPSGVKWKFVISSIPFTRNWRLNSGDTWAGYLYERRIILEAMWDVGMRGDGIGVVVLSGDRHEFAATAFSPPKGSKWPLSATIHEFSTSPLSMFYLPIRSYWERPGEDEVDEVCIKYVPDGNSKFGAVELEQVTGGEQGLLRFRLFVDGVETWNYVLMTPPAVTGGGRGKDAIWG